MKTQPWFHALLSLFLVATTVLPVGQPVLAVSQPIASQNVVYDPVTGALAFVGAEPGKSFASPLSNAVAQSPAQNAGAFASTYAAPMGLSNIAAELVLAKTATGPNGRSTIRYRQLYKGIPVFGGEVIVNTNAQGAMLSLTAKTSPNLQIDITPALTATNAVAAAFAAIAKYHNLEIKDLSANTPKLEIYDSRLLNPDGVPPRLVWNLIVSAVSAGISKRVLVDAQNGAIALYYDQVDSSALSGTSADTSNAGPGNFTLGAPQIGVYSLNHASPQPDDPDWPGTFICNQSNRTNCDGVGGDDVDATNAYLNALDAYNFMKNYLGIDSFNNAGVSSNASIHYGTGYQKVSWLTGSHIAWYGDGYAGADDMAGHAIGFGLLEYSGMADVVLAYQPGAIAESLTDMWGEFIDQTNGRGTDTAAAKWVVGEDWPGGAQRNMKDPTVAPFQHPDKMTSSFYYLGPVETDNGVGKFVNAGVNNKAVFLMTDGGTFNGKTIKALGIKKVANIYYEAEDRLLASSSTYFDLYYAVKQACYNLLGTQGITVDNCDQVKNALDAVEMNLSPSQTIYPVAKYCPPGKSKGNPTSLFFDSLETGTTKWTLTNPSSPANLWAQVSGDQTDGLNHFEGPEPGNTSEAIAQTTSAILIPSGYPVYLFFEHRFNFEASGANYHDGGLLFYTINNGATWSHTSALYASGLNYNGTLMSGTENPYQGSLAFVSSVRQYVSTAFNLSSLAGKSVKFRWVVASDSSVAGSGWSLDNIQVYRCISAPSIPTLTSPTNNGLTTNYKPVLRWSVSTPDLHHYVLQISTTAAFSTITYQATSTTNTHTLTTSLLPNKKYYWRVRAYNEANDTQGWSVVHYFRTAISAPTLLKPLGKITLRKPTFDWTDVAGATGYNLQVALMSNFSNPVINVAITQPISTYQAPSALLAHTTYYWRVATKAANGPSAWRQGSFTTP